MADTGPDLGLGRPKSTVERIFLKTSLGPGSWLINVIVCRPNLYFKSFAKTLVKTIFSTAATFRVRANGIFAS